MARAIRKGIEARQIYVELAGPDVPLVIQHNGELLRALETLAAQMLRLDHHEHDLVSFDAANFKALRAQELRLAAETAAEKVRQSGVPYSFPPMNSRERRMLHLACRSLEGIETASVGEGQDRFLVVYPEGKTDLPVDAAGQAQRLWPQVKQDSAQRRTGSLRGILSRLCHNIHL